jgi:aldehyde:ferredoxin oxidoreductase
VRFANPEKYLELAKEIHDTLRADVFIYDLQEYGTSDGIDDFPRAGMAAVHNFQSSSIPGEDVVLHRSYYDKYGVARICCFGCPVGCKDNYSVPGNGNGGSKCVNYHALTSLVSNTDLDLWWEATLYCQKQGIDITQIAGILAWVMELYQRGLITAEQTDGIPMEWGSRPAILDIIKKIVVREGIGNVLAEDYRTIAAELGKGTEDYFVHVKGNALEVIDIRTTKSCALGGAIGSNQHYLASCHAFEQLGYSFFAAPGRFTAEQVADYWKFAHEEAVKLTGTAKAADLDIDNYEGKAKLTFYTDDETVASNVMGFCKWHGAQMFGPHLTDKASALYEAGKGIEFTQEQMLEVTARVRCMEKAFEIREGATRADDTLSKRFFEPIKDGPFKGARIDPVKLEEMKTEYYTLRGWDPETGIPTRKTLEKLGLGNVADDLDRYAREGHSGGHRHHHGTSGETDDTQP